MKTLALITKRRVLEVVNNNDGTINILTSDGNQIAKIGSFIINMGGIDAVLSKTVEFEGSFEDFLKHHEAEKIAKHFENKAKNEVLKAETERLHAEKWDAIKDLPVIPATGENIRTLLIELNKQNWGSWKLPKLSIGYKCAQYNCDGITATTIVLDRKIQINEYCKPNNKYEYGAPFGHLTKYQSI